MLEIIAGIIGLLVIIGVIVYPAFRVMPYAYGSARLRSAKSKLISDREMESYSNKTYMDVVYHLEKKGFKELVPLADKNFSEALVQKVLRKKSVEEINRIITFVPSQMQKFFKVLRSRSDFDIIISVLRSKASPGYSRHIIDDMFVPTDNFKDLKAIKEMSLDDFMYKLKNTHFYKLVSAHMKEISDGDLRPVEKTLEQAYYRALLRESKGSRTLREYSKIQIDKYNVREALCLCQPQFLEGGNLSESIIKKLKDAKDVKEVSQILSRTHLKDHVKDAQNIQDIVKGLFRYSKSFAKKLFQQEPLSINPFIAYYITKQIELKNIRIILKLIHARFGSADIREAII